MEVSVKFENKTFTTSLFRKILLQARVFLTTRIVLRLENVI